ncbi:uncharacterized protein LOC128390754 [Panonychus citri]|uniref:uncharacterized protein LOC128390754 n=1 Tax=Panonychus citri TaxID=50023 RepID=UPI002307738A|nr:uncharacterized protein LOC128390754 [Panonychus citri]
MPQIAHLSDGKSVMILGTVVGCLIILWPKIFYPMLQNGFQTINQGDVKPKIHPRMMTSKSPPKGFNGQTNFYGPRSHIPSVDENNTIGGASVGLIMTIYTIGIIFLFFYTIFKFMSSNDSFDHLDKNGAHFDSRSKDTKKDENSFDKVDHKQGECLKKLAVNYVRCKSKISGIDNDPMIVNDRDDGVSIAYRTLLGDMLELRDYLSDLQCSINGCQPCDDEFCNCSDEVIYESDDICDSQTNDLGFDIDGTIDQILDSEDVSMKNEIDKPEEEQIINQSENEMDSVEDLLETIDDLIDSKIESKIKRLNKRKTSNEE